ncbi:MAG: D-alanine--D-alanine ligase [Oscillospiraceae bacterium]|nr:D-alanine--D-alanine ligase [Oscillospiraceae bacterium]
MSNTDKLNLCVIFGGMSPEHDISRMSCTSVLKNLNKDKYNISVIGITEKGEWYLYEGDFNGIRDWSPEKQSNKKAFISPDRSDKGILVFEETGIKKIPVDVIFPVMHGEYGEDGKIQGLFELSGINYVGCGVFASSAAMDKSRTKIILKDAGIPQADWVTVHTGQKNELENMGSILDNAEKKLGYPCFVKPAGTGSSVGVGKAKNKTELEAALKNAAKFDSTVLIEENIDGHEVECAVLGNLSPEASEIGEIIPEVEFYDFNAKYVDGTTKLKIPAQVDEKCREQIREYAKRAFTALGCRGLSRVDFFVRYSDGAIILNEINTLPGFTDISMYPMLWEHMGVKYTELLDRIINLSFERE